MESIFDRRPLKYACHGVIFIPRLAYLMAGAIIVLRSRRQWFPWTLPRPANTPGTAADALPIYISWTVSAKSI